MKIKSFVPVLLLSCFLFFSTAASAKSPVWRVSKDGHHVYIGGTFHLLTESDYPLPKAFETAYGKSAMLVLEADVQKLEAPEYQTALIQGAVYPGDRTIADFITPKTLSALKDHLASRGIPYEQIKKLKPGMLSLTLTLVELQILGYTGTGVDAFYNQKALTDRKTIRFLETPDEQVRFILELGQGYEDAFISYTLADIEKISQQMRQLKAAWKSGDNRQLEKIGMDPWKELFPGIYNMLIADRNDKWVPRILDMLKTQEVELVLFGALHLVGEDGILKQLRDLGFTIENM